MAIKLITQSADGLKLGPIRMVPGITTRHAMTAVYAAVAMNCFMAFVNVVQPMILTESLNVPTDQQGSVSGNLTFISELVALALFGPIGALSDRVGRRSIMALGFVALGAGYMLYPLATSVEMLYLSRMVFAIGVASVAVMMTTILNDYPQEDSRGKMMSLGGVANGVGGVLMVAVFAPLPLWLEAFGFAPATAIQSTLAIATTICLLSAAILYWGLSPMRFAAAKGESNILRSFVKGLGAAKAPRVAIAYGAAFVARSDLVVIGTFFLLWCVQAGVASGMSSAEATARSGILFAVMQISALGSAPLIGLLIDRVNRLTAVGICMIIVAVGYFALGMIDTPLNPVTFGVAVMIGAGMMAGMLSSQALIGECADPDIRGAMIGVFSLSGAVGILFITSVGGRVYDNWHETGPFLLIAAMGVVLALAAFVVRRKEIAESSGGPANLTHHEKSM